MGVLRDPRLYIRVVGPADAPVDWSVDPPEECDPGLNGDWDCCELDCDFEPDNEPCSNADPRNPENDCEKAECDGMGACMLENKLAGTECDDCTLDDECDANGNCEGTDVDCSDLDACTTDECKELEFWLVPPYECVNDPITQCGPADLCCPPGCDGLDPDCPSPVPSMNPVGLGLYIGMMALGGALLPRLRRGARRSAAIGLLALGLGFAASWWWTAPSDPPVREGCAVVAVEPADGAPT